MAWNGIIARSLPELFWPKVAKAGPEQCWNWTGGKGSSYGLLTLYQNRKPRVLRSHVACWEIHHGSVPRGLCVCHTCDNKRCCNPSHLFLGTRGDNNRDAARKGRQARGSRCPFFKLTEDQIRIIRQRYDSRPRGRGNPKGLINAMAEEFNVSKQTISNVAKRRRWKHVL